ncbi:S-phase kinase-associated protein 1 [Taenia solium]|eukprot:TsM_000365300 transcript=TsM_000365300 gene=TsM_000365300
MDELCTAPQLKMHRYDKACIIGAMLVVIAEPALVVLSAKMPVKLVTYDKVVFDVDLEVARQSVMIRDILEDVGPEAAEDDEPIPLQHVNADILRKVLQWCTHHKDDAPQEDFDDDGRHRTDDICSWDQEFLRVDQGTLIEILMAANYLDIEELLNMCCKTIANMIKGKKLMEIREMFNISSRGHR